MAKKKAVASTCGPSGYKWVGGVVTILLGLGLWLSYLTIEQFFGIVFVIMGLFKLFGKHHCCH
jgi:hypothetical protein